jgi:S-formylglutathione hydrolase FrmB
MTSATPRGVTVRVAALTAVLAVLTVGLAPAPAPAAVGDVRSPAAVGDLRSPVCVPRAEPVPDAPATLVSARPAPGAEERMLEVVLDSPALGGETAVNVLLPRGYDPDERYPVLYLLHGAAGSHRDWQTQGAVQRVVDETSQAHDLPPFIVVMPDAGTFGFYTDWYGTDVTGHNGTGPPPAWTTYHVQELIGWVDASLPTIPERRGRAVAGLSMGGFGTMTYATRFPDLFAAAASFSGAVNPSWGYPAGNLFLTGASGVFTGRGLDQCIWGDFATQRVRWLGTDPTHLAGNLAGTGTTLYVASGGGDLERPEGLVTDPVEQVIFLMNTAFVDALSAADVPHVVDFYAEGGHEWRYWQQGLGRFLPLMTEAFARTGEGPPTTFSHRSIEPAFSVWGWDFAVERDVTEFLYLTEVGATGLTARGSGTLEVVTAALHEPGSRHRVEVVTGDVVEVLEVSADDQGRLAFPVDLGPSHTLQQLRFDAFELAAWTQAVVAISPVEGDGPAR